MKIYLKVYFLPRREQAHFRHKDLQLMLLPQVFAVHGYSTTAFKGMNVMLRGLNRHV